MGRFKLPKIQIPTVSELKNRYLKVPDYKDPIVRKKLIIYALMGSSIGVVLTMAGMGPVNYPEFCNGLCHSQNPEYQSWKRSGHAGIGCKSCHTPPGGAGIFVYDEISQLWKAVLPELLQTYEKPTNAHSHVSQLHFASSVCMRCHNIENREFSGSDGLVVTSKDHQKHLKVGLRCTTCHNRITHKGAEQFEPLKTWIKGEEDIPDDFMYKDFMGMKEGCMRCHSRRNTKTVRGKKAPTPCTTCHEPGWEKLPIGHGKNWRDVEHGPASEENFNYCFNCHLEGAKFTYKEKTYCAACHDGQEIGEYLKTARSQPTPEPLF